MLAISLAVGHGCGGDGPDGVGAPRDAVARIGDEVVSQRIVEHLQERDGLDEGAARARAVDTLRLVAASRDAAAARPGEPEDELDPSRARQITRGARARVWLSETFEPRHRPEDIPDDHPPLVRARNDPRLVHDTPTVEYCQLILVTPTPPEDEEPSVTVDDPSWRARAGEIMDDLARRARTHVPEGDPGACPFWESTLRFEPPRWGEHHQIRFEKSGVPLEKCAEENEDGTCKTPALDPDWESRVADAAPGKFIDPFFTQFGLHLVYLHARHDPAPADDPETEKAVRAHVHPAWQREAFQATMERLRAERTVRIAAGAEAVDEL